MASLPVAWIASTMADGATAAWPDALACGIDGLSEQQPSCDNSPDPSTDISWSVRFPSTLLMPSSL